MQRHCTRCGRGLSRKHRICDPSARLLMAIFDEALCRECYRTKYPNHHID